MVENAISGETRLWLYMSACYLQELELALRLAGVPSRYERPGIDGILIPRLCVADSRNGQADAAICAIPRVFDVRRPAWKGPDPQWWFLWWKPPAQPRDPICPAVDMNEAARLVAAQLCA
jgi:hypothetical protein